MMRSLLILSLVLFVLPSRAQRLVEATFAKSGSISLTGFAQGAATGVSNAFLMDLISEDVLGSESIDAMLGSPRETQLIGADYGTKLSLDWPINGTSLSILGTVSDHFHASGEWNKDLSALALKGNTPYQGERMDIGPSGFRWAQFQKLGFGIRKRDLNSSMDIMVSYVNLEQFGQVELQQSSLYTSEIGDTLEFDLLGEFSMSDTSGGQRSHHGGGVAIDLSYHQVLKALDQDWAVSFIARDLGLVQAHPGGQHWQVDTMGSFSGILNVGFDDLTNGTLGESLQDSLDRSVNSFRSGGTQNIWLPGWIQLSMQQEKEKGFMFGLGGTWRPQAYGDPFGWVLIDHRFNSKWQVGADLGYGGYGSFQSSVRGLLNLKFLDLFLRVSNLEALILQNSFGGFGVSGGIQYRFEG